MSNVRADLPSFSISCSAEACYLNTGHPDFISGHKAMSIVNERLNPAPPPPAVDPKSKLPAGAVNNNKDLDVDIRDNQSFFGSFFSGNRNNKTKKGAMEPVSCRFLLWAISAQQDGMRAACRRSNALAPSVVNLANAASRFSQGIGNPYGP